MTNNIALSFKASDKLEDAQMYFEKCLEQKKRIGDQRGISLTLANIASIHIQQDRPNEAKTLLNESLEIAEQIAQKKDLSWIWCLKGQCATLIGDYSTAKADYEKGLKIAKSLQQQELIIQNQTAIAQLYFEENKYPKAIQVSNESLALINSLGGATAIPVNL